MEGYPAFAKVMSTNDGLDIFRRFSALNVLNLLYMQAEILDLELELHDTAAEDKDADSNTQSNRERRTYHLSARALRDSVRGEGDNLQWKKVLEIRKLLKEYNSALLQYAQLRKLGPANKHDLATLRQWLERPKHGNMFLETNLEGSAWRSENENDLIACSSRHEDNDGITKFVTEHVVPWIAERLHKRSSKTEKSDLIVYSNARLEYAVNISSSVISSILPAASIIALYFIHSLIIRLWVIIAFTTTFAIVLAVLVKPRRAEIFAATTAFAAVQVVFVGNTNNSSTS